MYLVTVEKLLHRTRWFRWFNAERCRKLVREFRIHNELLHSNLIWETDNFINLAVLEIRNETVEIRIVKGRLESNTYDFKLTDYPGAGVYPLGSCDRIIGLKNLPGPRRPPSS